MKALFPVTLFSALTLVACNPSATQDDGKGAVTLSFSASQTARTMLRTTINDIPVTDTAGNVSGNINMTEAWMVVKEIELEHEDDDDTADLDESKLEFIGPYALDLLSGMTYPALPEVTIDTGLYADIELDIEKLASEDLVGMPDLPQGVADKLLTYSLYIEGSYTSADGTTYVAIPFTLSYDQTDEFEFSGTDFSAGFVVDDQGINDIIVAFRLNEWFRFDNTETNSDNWTLEDAVINNGNGDEIMLSGNTNSEVMNVIEDNIEDSAEYGKDEDGDHELDEDEDDDGIDS
ncbi:hypothetical protein [Reinekea sp. G2M2-21]|uniref:hypothetical protein n=1 Tax=Reinekea sp. G2M2-21 TaxID=2788942 RepID=UPI0018A95E82|nr:hypothetical protein [Reinekea sp. G2M2-21]